MRDPATADGGKEEGENGMKIKNAVLKLITLLSFAVIFGLDFDNVSNVIPGACMYLLALAWLTIFIYSNNRRAKQ